MNELGYSLEHMLFIRLLVRVIWAAECFSFLLVLKRIFGDSQPLDLGGVILGEKIPDAIQSIAIRIGVVKVKIVAVG